MSTAYKATKVDIDLLVSMGYQAEEARTALDRANGDVQYAIDILCRGGKQ
jgi:NACalpha-BTF3-like transcription factor